MEDVSKQDIEKKDKLSLLQPDSEPDFDQYIIKFEELTKDFKKELIAKLTNSDRMLFTELIKEKNSLEQSRAFLLLLFAAIDGIVTLEQLESPDSLESDIVITRVLQ